MVRLAPGILAALLVILSTGCSDSAGSSAEAPATGVKRPTQPAASAATSLPAASPGAAAAPRPLGEELSLEVKVGQLIFTGVPGTTVGVQAERLLGELHIGNVVLMGENAGPPAQLAALTSQLQELARRSNGVGALIATDQEGGSVQRLTQGFTRLPAAASIGATSRPDLVRRYGELVGDELSAVGVNMALGPVLDVNDNPANPVIGRRAFGRNAEAVAAAGVPYIEGLHAGGAIAVGKHYPGHGNTETDSHFTLPVVKKPAHELELTELAPFEAAIDAGLDAVMVAHVAYPALDPSGLPASLSPTIGRALKERLGDQGVVVTDDLGMAGVAALMAPEEAALRAVLAGADLVICVSVPCDATRVQARLLRAAQTGELPESRLNDAVRRVLELKRAYDVGAAARGKLDQVGSGAHRALVAEIVEAAGGG